MEKFLLFNLFSEIASWSSVTFGWIAKRHHHARFMHVGYPVQFDKRSWRAVFKQHLACGVYNNNVNTFFRKRLLYAQQRISVINISQKHLVAGDNTGTTG